MKVLWDLNSAGGLVGRPVLSVGNFDGVHLGHQAILKQTIRLAHSMNRPPVVLTFEPHPQKVFKGEEAPPLLSTLPQKLRLFEGLGIAATLVCPFDERIYQHTADEFFSEVLVRKLSAIHLVEGVDFTFGRGRSGSPDLLQRLGRAHRIGVTIVDPVKFESQPISSSRIRACIRGGDVAKARALLGRPYRVEGKRTVGMGRGRTLGYPTINLLPENELVPAVGIYAVQGECDEEVHLGAASLGFNPTFEGDRFSFEVYLIDFKREVRNDRVDVLFFERLRDEIAFGRREDLVAQIEADVTQVRTIFRGYET
jgi:riboflavin kinase/FMN adenylyltransferase